ncbi:hypothetical protein M3N64_07425 [Sporolactobacillus sp. CPB3-1]|uniref:DUF2515 domain-containing protein n=1 Tax=Sporolactobacillus mangiferae TaxID=2940498 RepID=A0ABT0MAT3_9BACL|nr:hypothetical protein [Sporolactobacillus mangiferae]MCL1631778.1 hypothetical protein [Sporolactobacillus mangiferae]
MSTENQQDNPLNRLRHDHPDTFINEWKRIYQTDQQHAFQMINDPDLEFPVLFMLRNELETRSGQLAPRTQIALQHIRNVLHGADFGINHSASFAVQHDEVVSAMYWILKTGWKNIVSTDYTQVIDQTAIHLLHTYHENWLKGMVDLVIYRCKNKSQRHYLISALWETANPVCLVYLANYLLSNERVESSYARKMLAFIPEVRHALDNQAALLAFETWYEENAHYLVYTGETNDAVPGARPFKIHYSAKYLGKIVSPSNGEPVQAFSKQEKKNYDEFIKLPHRTQIHLSAYSSRLRKLQSKIWRNWVMQPVKEQLQSENVPLHGGDYL